MNDFKKIITDFISAKFKGTLQSDKEKLSDIIALLMSQKTVSVETLERLKKFYQKDKNNRMVFFNILSNFKYVNVELLLNTIYAIDDNPLWPVQLTDDLDKILAYINNQDSMIDLDGLVKVRSYFRSYFSRIFNLQYLMTSEYNASNTPINLLKYIARKDGIHPASHWSVFEERLNIPEHILLGLEHFKLKSQPVVYVEIALSRGLIKSIHDIIGENKLRVDLKKADTAIFYSLNITFKSLAGIGLGEKMIIRAKEYIKFHYPHIEAFSTLSPVPGLRKYFETIVLDPMASFSLSKEMLDDTSKKNSDFPLKNIDSIRKEYERLNPDKNDSFSEMLLKILNSNKWFTNPVFIKNIEEPLVKLCKYYLIKEKKKDRETDQIGYAALDTVANFHLSNGASIGSINYLANLTDKGLDESFGMMVNFIYKDKKLDSNKIKYSQGIIDSLI